MTPKNIQLMNDKILNPLLMMALLVITAMTLLPLLNVHQPWMRWAFAAAALVVLAVRVLQRYDGQNLRIRRLYRINIVSALLFCTSAVMFWNMGQTQWSTNWVAFLMAGAALMMYVTFAIDHEQRRIDRNNDKPKD